MGGNRAQDPGPAAYGREALSEWAKAARYGVRAIAARRHQASDGGRPPLKERLNPWRTSKGGRVGDAADRALSKLGTGGKLASKIGLGSRLVDRLQPSNGGRGRGEAKQGQNGSQASQDVDREAPLAD